MSTTETIEKAVEIPAGISYREFFLDWAPKTYMKRAAEHDMSGYGGLDVTLQVDVLAPDERQSFVIQIVDGKEIRSREGTAEAPLLTYTVSSDTLLKGLRKEIPWMPLDMVYDPEVLLSKLPPQQAREQFDILSTMAGQADARVENRDGTILEGRINFQNASEPAVVFNTNEEVTRDILEGNQTVMEAFMASRIKVEGQIEFAMHIMALAPEDDE